MTWPSTLRDFCRGGGFWGAWPMGGRDGERKSGPLFFDGLRVEPHPDS